MTPRLAALIFFTLGLAISAAAGQPQQGKVLYYRDPMDRPYYSAEPKKDEMGMDYIAVYEGEEDSGQAPPPPTAPTAPAKGKILYYRNPMGLPDTSPVPKKDSMGMDYIPVYEAETGDETGTVKIGLAKVQKLGVQSAPVERRRLSRTIRAVGTVQADERRLYIVNTKFEGWIDKLYVNATGETVRRGQPLMEIYAPELVVAEREYLLAWRSLQDMADAGPEIRKSASQLAEAALQRLSNWDISADQVKRLQRAGTVTRTLTLRAPADGTVMEKMAVEGMHFTAGDPLYRIADLSSVWLTAEVFERDIGLLHRGQDVTNRRQRLSRHGVHRQGRFHLSDRVARDANGQGTDRRPKWRRPAQDGHVCQCRRQYRRRRRAGPRNPRFGGDRQRYAPGCADRARRRHFRTAGGQTWSARRRLLSGAPGT